MFAIPYLRTIEFIRNNYIHFETPCKFMTKDIAKKKTHYIKNS